MNNPIPAPVRGWLYVIGIVVGGLVAVCLPDLLTALDAAPVWTAFATRTCGALTVLLSTLGRANLSDPSASLPPVYADDRIDRGAPAA